MPGSLQPVLPLPQDPSTQLVVLPTEPAAHPVTHHLGEPHYCPLSFLNGFLLLHVTLHPYLVTPIPHYTFTP